MSFEALSVYKFFDSFNLLIFSRDHDGQVKFLLRQKKKSPHFTHIHGAFHGNEPSILVALAKKFTQKTAGLLSAQNFPYFRKEDPEVCDPSEIYFERRTKFTKPSYTLSPALNDICQQICESPYFFQDDSDTATYLVEIPMLDLDRLHEHIQNIGMTHEFKYFTLQDILEDTATEVHETTQNLFFNNPDFYNYIQKYVINQEDAGKTETYGLICCEIFLRSCMLHALHYPAFKKHGETWKFYKAYQNELPTDEELLQMKGLIIPGSSCSAYDTNIDWYQGVFELIRKIHSQYTTVKLLGICFGAQIIAQALGGRVEKMPRGPMNGEEVLKVKPEFFDLPYVKAAGLKSTQQLVIAQAHGDHIVELPPNAKHFGSSDSANVEIFTINDNILAFQGHPDYNEMSIVWSNMRNKNFNAKNHKMFEEEVMKTKFPLPLTQNETLKICFYFLKSSKHPQPNQNLEELECPIIPGVFNDQYLYF